LRGRYDRSNLMAVGFIEIAALRSQ